MSGWQPSPELNKRLELNKARQIATRNEKKLNVPDQVQRFLCELLTHCGKRTEYFKTCITCKHFELEQENCKLYNIRPPASVIADGCTSYEDFDPIPF